MAEQITLTLELVPEGNEFKAHSIFMDEAAIIKIDKLHKIIKFAEEKAILFSNEIKELSANPDHSKIMTLCWPDASCTEYKIGIIISNTDNLK